jgi:hypothetical protein
VLPDYPETKRQVGRVLDRRLREKHREALGPLAQIQPRRVFEGEALAFQPDGQQPKTLDLVPIAAQVEMSASEAQNLTLPQVLQKVDELAGKMAKAQAEFTYRRMQEDLDEAGQAVHAQGAPLSPELVFQVLEKMEFDFDEQGQIEGLTVVVHPSGAQALEGVMRRISEDPILKARFEDLKARKRAGWDARENSRRLVG